MKEEVKYKSRNIPVMLLPGRSPQLLPQEGQASDETKTRALALLTELFFKHCCELQNCVSTDAIPSGLINCPGKHIRTNPHSQARTSLLKQ